MGSEDFFDPFNFKLESDFPYADKLTSHVKLLCDDFRAIEIDSAADILSHIASITKEAFNLAKASIVEEETKAKARFRFSELIKEHTSFLCLIQSWVLTNRALDVLQHPLDTFVMGEELERFLEQDTSVGKRLHEQLDPIVATASEDRPNWEAGSLYLIEAIEYRAAIPSEKATQKATKALASLGGIAAAKKWDKAKAMAIEIATERWDPDASSDLSHDRIGIVANDIRDAIQADLAALELTAVPTQELVMRWIRGAAPPGATKGGRPKNPPT